MKAIKIVVFLIIATAICRGTEGKIEMYASARVTDDSGLANSRVGIRIEVVCKNLTGRRVRLPRPTEPPTLAYAGYKIASGVLIVEFASRFKHGPKGERLVPSPCELQVVDLEETEAMEFFGNIFVSRGIAGLPKTISVSFVIDDEVGKRFDTWSGTITGDVIDWIAPEVGDRSEGK